MRFKPMMMPLILACLVLAACGPAGPDPIEQRKLDSEVVINIGSDPRSLHPSICTDIPAARAVLCMTRGLTLVDGEGKVRPELAESWEVSPDGLTYTFKLRDAKWSNGDRVTSDDFVHAWMDCMLNPAFAAEYAYMLYCIEGAEQYFENPEEGLAELGLLAPSPDTLMVRLRAPTPYFLELVAHHSFFPVNRRVSEGNKDWFTSPDTYVGCGPYTMVSYVSGGELVLKKNPTYWNADAVSIENIRLRMTERESTALAAYENDEIDAIMAVPREELDRLKTLPDLQYAPLYSTYYVDFNCAVLGLDDARVRRALAMAIPREQIVTHLTKAGEPPALTLTPPVLYHGNPPQSPIRDADFEAARQLLADAGYPNGEGLPTFNYIYNTMDMHRQIAQVIQETWRKELGVNIQLENQEFKVVIDRRREGDFDMARAGWVADFGDPINFLELGYSKAENNTSNYDNPRYDQMLEAARLEADPDKRMDLLRQAEEYLLNDMPIAPIYVYTNPIMVNPELEGFKINPYGMFDAVTMKWKPVAAE